MGNTDDTEPQHLMASEIESVALQLQRQLDWVTAERDRLRTRVGKLEDDRRVLRERLERRQGRRGLRPASRRPRTTGDGAGGSLQGDKSINVPDGVGRIDDAELPDPPPTRGNLVVGTVLDRFSRASFGPEFEARDIMSPTWQDDAERADPDLLLVESAFSGPEESWSNRIARVGPPSDELAGLVRWCRQRGIPTVFWNKEDPTNYAWFIGSASLFDWVFTTDAASLPRYRSTLGHNRVAVLPFAAQPAHQLPGPAWVDRPGRVAFAGSYYAAKHPERIAQIDQIVDPARGFGLHIFDRFGGSSDERFAWPERFQKHIVGALTYPQVLEAYRRYRVFLNINTVTDSPTMCARRIFELAACGTPVLTGPSRAIAEMVPGRAITVSNSIDGTTAALLRLLEQPEAWQEQADSARDWVLSEHTYSHRVDTILETLGL